MGTKIGAAWHKFSNNGTEYIQISINKEMFPLTITDKQKLIMFAVPKDKQKENSPQYELILEVFKEKAD